MLLRLAQALVASFGPAVKEDTAQQQEQRGPAVKEGPGTERGLSDIMTAAGIQLMVAPGSVKQEPGAVRQGAAPADEGGEQGEEEAPAHEEWHSEEEWAKLAQRTSRLLAALALVPGKWAGAAGHLAGAQKLSLALAGCRQR